MNTMPVRTWLGWFLAAALILVVLRLPFIRGEFLSIDESVYAAIADQMLHGAIPYRDTWERHPPLILWYYAGMFALFRRSMAAVQAGIIPILSAAAALHAGSIRGLLERSSRPGALEWIVAGLLAAFLSLYQVNEFHAANTEMLMVLFLGGALAASQCAGRWPRAAMLVAGACLGLAIQCKQVAALNIAVIGGGELLRVLVAKPTGWRRFERVVWLGTGLAASLGPIFGYFAAHGAMADLLFQNYGINRLYIDAGQGGISREESLGRAWAVIRPHLLLWTGGLAGMVLLTWRAFRQGSDPERRVELATAAAWIGASAIGVGVGGRFFGHYFVQALPALAIGVAVSLHAGWTSAGGPGRLALAALVLAGTLWPLTGYPSFPRVESNAELFVHGTREMALPLAPLLRAYREALRPLPLSRERELAREIRSMTRDGDTIFVWGFMSHVYWLSDRSCGTRFTFCDFLTPHEAGSPDNPNTIVPGAMELLVADLRRNRPALLIDTSPANYFEYGRFPMSGYPALAAVVEELYEPAGEWRGMVLYRLRETVR